jgi:hypothetical protein
MGRTPAYPSRARAAGTAPAGHADADTAAEMLDGRPMPTPAPNGEDTSFSPLTLPLAFSGLALAYPYPVAYSPPAPALRRIAKHKTLIPSSNAGIGW